MNASPRAKNTRTGLLESVHDYYKVPVVHQRGLGRLRLDGQLTAIHTVPFREGMTLDFYSRLKRSDEIIVTFHGAGDLTKLTYPVFTRVKSLQTKAPAMMSFADPTMLVDPERAMKLSWFLGGPGWDPLPPIIAVIRKAMGKCGAKHVAFLGGSGGGFAALRASAMVPGSMAFVQDPQVTIAEYSPNVVKTYFDTVWKGWSRSSLMNAFPERFDMARHYRTARPRNFVYYAQNSTDHFHVQKHYEPFLDASGVTGEQPVIRLRNRTFNRYDGELTGHGKITATEFDTFYADAMSGWRAFRGN